MKQRINQTVSESEGSEAENSVITDPLDKFAADHPTYQRIQIDEDFSDSDEVSFIKIPKGQDPNIFLNQRVRLDSSTKIKIDNMRIKITPEVDQPKPFLLLAKSARIGRPLAYLTTEIILKENDEINVDVQNYNADGPSEENQNKARHPHFGDGYMEKMHLDEKTTQALEDTVSSVGKSHKKKKKRKAQELEENEIAPEATDELADSSHKKRKKHKTNFQDTLFSGDVSIY